MLREICGESAWKKFIFVTNMWEDHSQTTNEAHERELRGKLFKPALDMGAQIVRHHNTVESAHNIIQMIVADGPVVLQIQRELVDQRRYIGDTAAGKAITQEPKEQIRRHEAELTTVREEVEEALGEEDEERRRELEEEEMMLQEEEGRLRELMVKIAKDEKEMLVGYAAEKERIEAKPKGMLWGAQKREDDEAGRIHSHWDETIVADRARWPQDLSLTDTLAVISPNDLQQSLPTLLSSSSRIAYLRTWYVRVPFRFAAHDDRISS